MDPITVVDRVKHDKRLEKYQENMEAALALHSFIGDAVCMSTVDRTAA